MRHCQTYVCRTVDEVGRAQAGFDRLEERGDGARVGSITRQADDAMLLLQWSAGYVTGHILEGQEFEIITIIAKCDHTLGGAHRLR